MILTIFALASYIIIKNKCIFVKNYNPNDIQFNNPQNIAILNAPCGKCYYRTLPRCFS